MLKQKNLWKQALNCFWHKDYLVDGTRVAKVDNLIAAATVVVSDFSSCLDIAALLRNPAIAVLYPEIGLKRYQELNKWKLPAMVMAGCATLASNIEKN